MEKLANNSLVSDVNAEAPSDQEIVVPDIWYEDGLKIASDGTPRRANGEFASRNEVIAYLGSLVNAHLVQQAVTPDALRSQRREELGYFGSNTPNLDVQPLRFQRKIPDGAISTEAIGLSRTASGKARVNNTHDDLWKSFAGRTNRPAHKRAA